MKEGHFNKIIRFRYLLLEAMCQIGDCVPANLKNSAVATGLEKVSLHFSPKERQ